jgi:hypothetical protein
VSETGWSPGLGGARLLDGIVRELSQTKTISDLARPRLLKTREALVPGWNEVAAKLESQGEIVLGGQLRYFAMHVPPVLTDRGRLAAELIQFAKERRSASTRGDDRLRDGAVPSTSSGVSMPTCFFGGQNRDARSGSAFTGRLSRRPQCSFSIARAVRRSPGLVFFPRRRLSPS